MCILQRYLFKVRVKLAEFSWHDLTYFGPRHSIFWYMRHVSKQWRVLQSFCEKSGPFLSIAQKCIVRTFHAHYRECILRGITSASIREINSHLNGNYPYSFKDLFLTVHIRYLVWWGSKTSERHRDMTWGIHLPRTALHASLVLNEQ